MKRKITSKIRDINIKGSGRVSLFLAKLFFGKPKGKLTVDTIYDFKLNIDPVTDKGVERIIYYYGTYEKGTLDVIGKILKKGDMFVDVGANIGLMSIFASRTVEQEGKVIAFEPNPLTKKILESNVALNKIENLKIAGLALSNENKKSKIYDRWDVNRGGASLIKPSKPTNSYDIEEVKFSDYFNNGEQIKLVKIDVEGYELDVLKGASQFILTSKNPPSLIVEFSTTRINTFGKDTTPLFTFLDELNIYRFFKSIRGKEKTSKLIEIKNTENLPRIENIFCLTKKHLSELPQEVFKIMPNKK
ncbi:FkbM family methyltransferase [Lacinutrix cladophorae]